MAPGASFIEENDRERERMRSLVERLTEDELRKQVNPHWTVAGVLGHIAFWDARVLYLVNKLESDIPFSEDDYEREDVDWINDSARPLIHAVRPKDLARLSMEIAEETDGRVAKIDPQRMYPEDESSPVNPVRATHRGEHLDDIEKALSPK